MWSGKDSVMVECARLSVHNEGFKTVLVKV